MHYRALGRTGWKVSEISFGAWAIGGAWGQVSDEESMAALHKAVDSGVNFIDTADVYGDGRSERLIARLKKERGDKAEIIVATKAGRRLPRQTVEGYSRQNLSSWINDSLRNLSTERIDLVQLHCPPTALYSRPEVFGILDDLVAEGKIRYYGVSVEKVEEALRRSSFRMCRPCRSSSIVFDSVPRKPFSPRLKKNKWAFWRGCLWPADCLPANCDATQASRKTITATSIDRVRPSTWARPSPEWTTRLA